MTTVPPGKVATDKANTDLRLQTLLAAPGLESVRATLIGRRLILEGNVGSYEAKCRIEKAARGLALHLESCLKVIPGAFFDSPPLPREPERFAA